MRSGRTRSRVERERLADPRFDIEIFHGRPDPYLSPTLHEVEKALDALRLPTDRVHVKTVAVLSIEDARDHGVSGIPTVRVNGHDVAHEESRPNVAHREYVWPDHETHPYPSATLIADALQGAR